MSHPDHKSFVADIPVNDPEAMQEFQVAMDAHAAAMNRYIRQIANELNTSDACACNVIYLRGRSRWTQELEEKLIKLHDKGNPPNMFEFGN